jgi:hypothetical protein
MNPYPVGLFQILSIAGSFGLLGLLIFLIRKRKLKEEYAILWIVISVVFLVIAVFRGLIDWISQIFGIHYQPAALFIILIFCLYLLMLHFSIVTSDLRMKINTLLMKITLLEEEASRLRQGSDQSESDQNP